MADTTPAPAVPAVAPGAQSSEHALAKFVTYLAAAIAVLGTISSFLGAVSPVFAQVPAVGKVLAVSGVVVAMLTQAAYGLQRTVIKIAALNAGAQPSPDTSASAVDSAAANLAK